MPEPSLKIIIADDHPLFRTALHKCLVQTLGEISVHEASDLNSLQRVLQSHADTDLLLLDLYMPGTNGFSGLIFINTHYEQVPVVVISANENPDVMQEAIACGAAGFLPKSSTSAVIAEAIKQVLSGRLWLPENAQVRSPETPLSAKNLKSVLASLTPQQYRVAMMLYSGLQNKHIAAEMQVTEATIKAHLTSIFRKFGVKTRTQAVLLLRELEIKAPV